MKVLVCGSRSIDMADLVWATLCQLHDQEPITCIVHGDCRGPDRIAADWTRSRGIEGRAYPADWKKHGRAAGAIRNGEMLAKEQPDLVLAFWDGISRGTRHMIALTERAGVKVQIVAVPVA